MKTETEIETLLRKAPAPAPSRELGATLKNAIRLPQSPNGAGMKLTVSFWSRWLPAIGYAVMVLGCVVVLAVQNQQKDAVLQQLEKLQGEIAIKEEQLDQKRERERQTLAAGARLNELMENADKADQLTLKLEELRALIAQLTAEATDLEAMLAEAPESNQIIAPYDFFNDPGGPMQETREEATSISCINNMKQIGLAIRIWANDNNDRFPPNLNSMTNELSVLKVLCCPEDTVNLALANQLRTFPGQGWSRWPINGGSYEVFLSDTVNDSTPDVIITRCRFHGHVGWADGSVHRGDVKGGSTP